MVDEGLGARETHRSAVTAVGPPTSRVCQALSGTADSSAAPQARSSARGRMFFVPRRREHAGPRADLSYEGLKLLYYVYEGLSLIKIRSR